MEPQKHGDTKFLLGLPELRPADKKVFFVPSCLCGSTLFCLFWQPRSRECMGIEHSGISAFDTCLASFSTPVSKNPLDGCGQDKSKIQLTLQVIRRLIRVGRYAFDVDFFRLWNYHRRSAFSRIVFWVPWSLPWYLILTVQARSFSQLALPFLPIVWAQAVVE